MSMSSTSPAHAVPAWVPRDLFPFQSRFIDLDGHTVHYIDEGEGPTLLLLHGNPTWSFLYRHIVTALRESFRCIALDYPGFGLSTPADGYDAMPASHARVVARFVDALELEPFTPMVQDWAGPIGLWVAAQRPDRVHGLIIGNTWAWPIDGDKHFERFSKMMGGPIGRIGIRHANMFVNVMIPMGVKRRRLTRKIKQAYRRPFPTKAARIRTWIFPREIRESRAFLGEVRDGLAKLADKPTLILWGTRDIAFRSTERERFEAAFPTHRTVILDGAGHYIQEDAPTQIAAAIRRMWTEPIGDEEGAAES